ncbi:MAG: FAD:protein FMN transferase [Lachnospiraceae bacterium]|nr:FAD:protein FMN transferase [Lachnospiraceae bacterium]
MLRRFTAILCTMIMIFPFLTACRSAEGKPLTGTFFMFDTVVSVSLYDTEDENLLEECRSFLEGYEDVFSATRETSELYRVNHSEFAEGKDILISEDLFNAIARSLEWCELTEGRFDITIRPVSQLYVFPTDNFEPPSPESIEEALTHVSYKNISVCEKNGDFFLHTGAPGIMLDLGAVSKGYISDRLKEFLIGKGIKSAVIDLGGNIMCIGGKKLGNGEEEAFNIGIYDPLNPGNEQADSESDGSGSVVLKIYDECVITSGIYQRSAEKDGVLYHHILDARTGFPAAGNVEAVSVVCREGIMGDILSTSLFLLAQDEIKAKLPEDTGVMYLYRDGSREYDGIFKEMLR